MNRPFKAPWNSKKLRGAKRKRRQYERKATKPQAPQIDNDLLQNTKREFLHANIENANQRQLVQVVDKITSPVDRIILSGHTSDVHLANQFANLFKLKIDRLRNELNVYLMTAPSTSLKQLKHHFFMRSMLFLKIKCSQSSSLPHLPPAI